jgi:hypothetical protein
LLISGPGAPIENRTGLSGKYKFDLTRLARIIRETPARGVLVDEIGAKVLAALV